MTPYSVLIEKQLKGDTPKEKFDNLLLMKEILKRVAYPVVESDDWYMTIEDFAKEIQEHFSLADLED